MIVAGLTDGLDGILARSLNQKTALGAYLDPIADKLLLSSSFVVLALNRKISWWLATLVLSRDIMLLTAAAVILVVVGYRPFPPSIYGKATTALQILLVFAVVLLAVTDWAWLQFIRNIIGYLVAGFTVFSGFHYCFTVARRMSEQQHDLSRTGFSLSGFDVRLARNETDRLKPVLLKPYALCK